MPIFKSRFYSLPLEAAGAGGHSPADSTRYYIGNTGTINPGSTTPNGFECIVPENGVIRQVRFNAMMLAGTTPSTHLSTVALYVNGAAAATLTNAFTMSSVVNNLANDTCSVFVRAMDRVEIQISTPAWSTNPTVVFYRGAFIVESGLE